GPHHRRRALARGRAGQPRRGAGPRDDRRRRWGEPGRRPAPDPRPGGVRPAPHGAWAPAGGADPARGARPGGRVHRRRRPGPLPGRAMRVRVASYNLRGLGDDAAAAAQVVRALDPDVLLLQEVPRHPGSSYRISAFARACDLLWSGRTRLLSRTAVLTSLRVVASDAV